MKTSKVFFLSSLFVLFCGLSAFAHGPSISPEKDKSLSNQISSLISKVDFSSIKSDIKNLTVKFIVNNDNEIVVLDVSDEKFETPIVSKLNYQKVDAQGIEKNKLFLIPVIVERR